MILRVNVVLLCLVAGYLTWDHITSETMGLRFGVERYIEFSLDEEREVYFFINYLDMHRHPFSVYLMTREEFMDLERRKAEYLKRYNMTSLNNYDCGSLYDESSVLWKSEGRRRHKLKDIVLGKGEYVIVITWVNGSQETTIGGLVKFF